MIELLDVLQHRSGISRKILESYMIEMVDGSRPLYEADFQTLTDANMQNART